MPQMMPLSWLTLMMMFILIFMLFNNWNYFSFLYNIKKSSTNKKNTNTNWKW